MVTNYIVDKNRFSLAGPPDWFLRQLAEFDESLVIIPSRQECVYRLCQRRKPRIAESIVNDVLKEQADTQMMWSYGLIPVTTIIATVQWNNPLIFVELHNRAPHRLGGHEKVSAALDARDAAADLAKQALIDERNTYTASDAWRMYRKKIGLTTHAFLAPKPKVSDTEKFRVSGKSAGIIIK